MCTFVQHMNWITKHALHMYCKGIEWARLTIYDQNKWRAVFSRVYTIHGVLDQSDHCSRSRTRALDQARTKTWADCKASQPDPILFSDFHNDTHCNCIPQAQPAFLSQLSNYQVDSITPAFVSNALRFMIRVVLICYLSLVQMAILHDSMGSSW